MRRSLVVSVLVLIMLAIAVVVAQPDRSANATRPDRSLKTCQVCTTLTTDTITIPTYPYASFLYTATNATYNIPYRWLNWGQYDGSHPQPVSQTYTRLTLENEWLRVSVLPQLGGRVYELINKATGNNELYRNPVIKPTNWGPPEQGWWLAAGGLEWGLPVEEHGYESAIPWLYDVITSTDGITITVRDSISPDRLRAAISIYLPDDRAALIVRPRIENDRNVDLNFKWWDNAMVAPGPGNSVGTYFNNPNNIDLKFVLPESQVTVHSTGDTQLPGEGQAMSWSIYKNVDRSLLQNWKQWLGFFVRPNASHDWAGAIDRAHQEGLVRVFPHTVATGSKGFGMGWRNPIGAEQWTDDGSYYAELHGGLAPTFWDSASIGAHQAIEWEETWYPLAGLNDITAANGEAALHIELTGSLLNIGVYSTRAHAHARVSVYQRTPGCGADVYDLTDLTPATPFTHTIPTKPGVSDLAALFTDGDTTLAAYNITNDGHPPIVSVEALPTFVTTSTFTVTWTGSDSDCIRSFDVQVRDGFDGVWTPWLTDVVKESHPFTGVDGHTYFFRVRARDLAGNQSAYVPDQSNNAFTSVLITAAPVLETSFKWTWPFTNLNHSIDYTIFINNTGSLSATVSLTDTLPSNTALISGTLAIDAMPAPTFDGDTIHWTGIVTGGGTYLRLTYALTSTIDLPPGSIVTNTAVIAYTGRVITRTATTTVPYRAYLPLVTRNFTAP
jgi:uncharacterized repeat protein (TIGR01451 family)